MTPFEIKLPATSANLGPGFDAVGLAMALYLTIEARVADSFHITATGVDAELCASLERNLILETYREVAGSTAPALALTLHNEIPLGMGCGSSAAALLAGVFLANHFSSLGWTPEQILEEACRREGHPDNVAACFYGGMTISAEVDGRIVATTCGVDLTWRLILAHPAASLATEKARALLPDGYSRADAVANIQSVALLTAAFALDRPELLHAATRDRIHQPYRSEACALLPALLPLSGTQGIYGVALSGAGPSVLLLSDPAAELDPVLDRIRTLAGDFNPKTRVISISSGAVTRMLPR